MKVKTIIVILIIVVALGVGFHLFQNNKQEEALVSHNKENFQKITKAAQQSSSIGLPVMASAINKFHQTNGRYPKTLLELYPQFIPDRPFISILNWQYHSDNKTYLLKRSIKGQKTVASIGPDLKLKVGVEDSTIKSKAIASSISPKAKKTITAQTVALKSTKTKVAPQPKATKGIQENKRLSSLNIDKNSKGVKKNTVPEPSIRIVKKELDKNEKFLLSFDGSKLYIWKTKDGIIGFSNIQYPDEKRLTIYRDQNWFEYGVSQNSRKKK